MMEIILDVANIILSVIVIVYVAKNWRNTK